MIRSDVAIALLVMIFLFFGCGQKAGNGQAQDSPGVSEEQNRLADEKSPYLLQHADNPVNWHPWGEEAFEAAEEGNKLIFLSIGYSTCYWCHVMERQVFMNEEIAARMNRYFINIKVDREERPDVDRVYMTAVQAMTGGGGWPMSVFLTPDLKPFFGATYIPPFAQNGRAGFYELAENINQFWQNRKQQVLQQAEKITDHIREVSAPALEPEEVSSSVFEMAFSSFSDLFDPEYGGFGGAPKFPRPSGLDFLLQYHKDSGNKKALEMAELTLQKMAAGGMYDHIGEGFHRYSTDDQWRVPHFEKMLYDQAQLANTYLTAYEITGKEQYAGVARNIFEFVDRKFSNPEGGFYSALNAESPPPEDPDAEEEEGAYYLWTQAQIEEVLPDRQAAVFNYVYGVEAEGNALLDPHEVFTGKNILYRKHTSEEAAKEFNMGIERVNEILSEVKRTLFEIRKERHAPFLDDKIVLSWNGLMISAYANAYSGLGDEPYKEQAVRSVRFLMDKLYNPDSGELRRRYREGEARFEAEMVDYAYFVNGLLDLYEATGENEWLELAVQFTDTQIERFYDTQNGAFYDTRMENKNLLVRTKESYDGARPSGNSLALTNLVRLADLTDNREYEEKAAESMRTFGSYLNERPMAMPQMLIAHSLSRQGF